MTDLRRRRGTLWVVCVVMALPFFAACRFPRGAPSRSESLKALEEEPWGQPNVVLAEVNGRPITRGEVYLRVMRRFGTMQVLNGLIKEELFLQEAERLGVKVSSEQVDARVERIFADMQRKAGGLRELEAKYREEGLVLSTVRRDLARQVSTEVLFGEVTKALRKIDDDVILRYYKSTYRHKRYMTRQIAYSYYTEPGEPPGKTERLKMEARSKALRAVDRVRKGEDFATLARAESEDPVTAASGGFLGPVHEELKMTVPAFKTAIFQLQPGEVSEPVENPGRGFHVFQVTGILESESFADCREKIVEELRTMEPEVREIAATLRELERRGTVQMFDAPFVSPPRGAPPSAPPLERAGEAGAGTPEADAATVPGEETSP